MPTHGLSPRNLFQSTHPRGVRLIRTERTLQEIKISIHAPARGATKAVGGVDVPVDNFNPRTREGCDLIYSDRTICDPNFNPRTREGCDPLFTSSRDNKNFNPRTREGCDVQAISGASAADIFQSTHPRGVRRARKHRTRSDVTFQSTHPRGVRLYHGIYCNHKIRFQSTHPRGVRPALTLFSYGTRIISIHAPARGATRRNQRN